MSHCLAVVGLALGVVAAVGVVVTRCFGFLGEMHMKMFAKIGVMSVVLVGASWAEAAILGLGDIAFTGYQATSPDRVSFVLLRAVDSGTVLTITDNAWNGTALGTTEGNSVITFSRNFAAGTQLDFDATRNTSLRWTVGTSSTGLSESTSANFGLNASGDNLFAYNGSTAPTTGGSALWVSAFASNAFLTTGSSNSSLTYLPSAFTVGTNARSLGLVNFAANQNGALTSPRTFSGTAAQIGAAINGTATFTTYTAAGAQAIPPAITVTVVAGATAAIETAEVGTSLGSVGGLGSNGNYVIENVFTNGATSGSIAIGDGLASGTDSILVYFDRVSDTAAFPSLSGVTFTNGTFDFGTGAIYDAVASFSTRPSASTVYFNFDGFPALNNVAVVPEPSALLGMIAPAAMLVSRRRRA